MSKKIRTRNPLLKKNLHWENYELNEIITNVIDGYDLPLTEIPWQEEDQENSKKWKDVKKKVNNTEAMQYIKHTDYTHAQAVNYLEKEGYKIQRVVMPININTQSIGLGESKSKIVSEKVCTDYVHEFIKKNMSDIWNGPDKVERNWLFCSQSDYNAIKKFVRTYPHGKGKYAEAGLIKWLAQSLPKVQGNIKLATHNLSSSSQRKNNQKGGKTNAIK